VQVPGNHGNQGEGEKKGNGWHPVVDGPCQQARALKESRFSKIKGLREWKNIKGQANQEAFQRAGDLGVITGFGHDQIWPEIGQVWVVKHFRPMR